MSFAIFLLLIGMGLTVLLLFLFLRSGSSKSKNLVKTEEEELHTVVHELRAPLVAIKDGASLMLDQNLNLDEQKTMLNLIHDQSKKLLEQISTILDSAKVEDGKLSLNRTIGSLGQVVNNEVSLFSSEAKRKNITLTAEISADLPSFSFDQIRITEALNNIISNSLKYTNEGGHVIVGAKKSDGNVIVTVEDNGIGIPEGKQHMLFQKFANINDGHTNDGEKLSSGLGLYITKGIIEAHGGVISVVSQVGKGTTTTFTLPIVVQETPSVETQAQSQTPPLPN